MAAIAILSFVSCSKGDGEEVPPKEVSFTLSVAFPESGSMARASASDLYSEFYNKYIKTYDLTYECYDLSFSQNGEVVANFSGEWDADVITLPVGSYEVKGISTWDSLHDTYDYSKPRLSFDQKVIIDESTESLTLKAIYDCCMIMFDKQKFSEVSLYEFQTGRLISFGETDKIFYLFPFPNKSNREINYTAAGGGLGCVKVDFSILEKGKYYAFDLTSGSFTIPEMQPATAE